MRMLFLSLTLMLNGVVVLAQQDVNLPGEVVELNSGFHTGEVNYLPNVQVKAPGANPQLTDARGQFALVFPDRPFGDVARVYATKSGFELVNAEELKRAAVTGRRSPVKVVMCREGQLYENQVAYYQIAEETAISAYQKRLTQLEREGQGRERLLSEMRATYDREIATLEEARAILVRERQAAETRARELADKFVTINLDDQSAIYQRAFRAFMNKELERALTILDSVDLAERLATNTVERAKEVELVDTYRQRILERDNQIEQDVNQCVFKARLQILNYEFAAAEELFDLALRYSPENDDLRLEFAWFLRRQNKYAKSQQLIESALANYRKQAESDPITYLPYLARALNNMGVILMDNDQLEEAREHFVDAVTLFRKLAESNPEVYRLQVANTLGNLGKLWGIRKEVTVSRAYYDSAFTIRRTLATADPQQYSGQLAVDLIGLGVLYMNTHDLDTAKLYYIEALDTLRSLVADNPERYLPNLSLTLNNLGLLSRDRGEPDSARAYYAEAIAIREKLVEKNPDAYRPLLATSIYNLGIVLADNREAAAAREYYEQALAIREKMAEKYPGVYLPGVAHILSNLGNLWQYTGETEEPRAALERSLAIYRSLAEQNPDVYLYHVAHNLNNLGAFEWDTGNRASGLGYLQESWVVRKKLAAANPRAYNIDVALSALNLAMAAQEELPVTGNLALRDSSIALLEDARGRLGIYAPDHPRVRQYTPYVDDLYDYFTSYRDDDFAFAQRLVAVTALRDRYATATDPQVRVVGQQAIVDTLLRIERDFSDHPRARMTLATALGELAWYHLFVREFAAAEKAARRGLERAPADERIDGRLALALLLRGRWSKAEAILRRYHDRGVGSEQGWTEQFLADLDELEAAGITHPNFSKARALLAD